MLNILGKRVVTSIRVDEDVLKKAKDLGLNVSKVSENALKEMIKRIESPIIQTEHENYLDNTQKGLVRGTGLEPAQAYANRS